ncbi:MAG: gluconate:H+ symporter [Bryobacteraceae bacterium]|nr:gluconate:H+ symporter [Bryobacteraceae bacterium]
MTPEGPVLVLLTIAAVGVLLLLILVFKVHAFVALMVTSLALGLAAGMDPAKVLKSVQTGLGDTLGFIAVVIALGAMIGRFIEHSGGGRVLADWFLDKFGRDRAAWAVLAGAFVVGLPIFFDVAFIILAPIIWNLGRESKRSILFYGLPVAAALTVTHALVPPHPAPAAAAQLLGADLGLTILYGTLVSIPMAIAGGIVYGTWIAKRIFVPVPPMAESFAPKEETGKRPPHVAVVASILLLPLALIFGATIVEMAGLPGRPAAVFLGHPFTALTLALIAAVWVFGFRRGLSRTRVDKMSTDSLAPVASLMLITGAGGSFKQVIVDCGVGPYMGQALVAAHISPLVVAYLMSLVMRFAQGSATVAIITSAGILAPMMPSMPGYSPEMMVLAVACGGTALSHVNDSGFWIVSQYLGMSVPQTLRTWTVMKAIVSVVGFLAVLAAQATFFR